MFHKSISSNAELLAATQFTQAGCRSTPANWPSFRALSGFTRPEAVSLCSLKMLFMFARSITAKSLDEFTSATDSCSAMNLPKSLSRPSRSVKSMTEIFLLPDLEMAADKSPDSFWRIQHQLLRSVA